jgi:hypothetical protein
MVTNTVKFAAKLGAAAALAAGLFFTAQPASAEVAPNLSVTPSAGLADGAVVSVSITDAGANETYGVAQCTDISPGVLACNAATATGVTTDANGAATFPLTVNKVFEGFTPEGAPAGTIDCTAVDCYVGGGNATLGLGTVPISFAAEPVAAAPSLAVTPSAGLADGAVVSVSVTGAGANENYGVAQCADVSPGVLACNAATATGVTTDANGAAEFPLTVNKTFEGFTPEGAPAGTIDCAAVSCYVGGGNATLGLGTVSISFN